MEEKELDPKLEVIQLKKQLAIFDQELRQYQTNGAIAFYYELNSWQNQINEYMKTQKISALIGSEEKDKKFERVLKLIDQGKENVETLTHLRGILNITGKEDQDKENGKIPGKDFISNIAIKRS